MEAPTYFYSVVMFESIDLSQYILHSVVTAFLCDLLMIERWFAVAFLGLSTVWHTLRAFFLFSTYLREAEGL